MNQKDRLGWVNLVVMIVLAILGYVFVERNTDKLAYYNSEIAKIDLATRWQQNMNALTESIAKTQESKANATLTELNANLARLEGEVKSIKDRQEISLRQTQILSIVGDFINSIRPHGAIKPSEPALAADGVYLRYKLENYGKYPLEFGKPNLWLASEKLKEGEEAKGALEIGRDYLIEYLSRPGEISAGSSREYQVHVISVKGFPRTLHSFLNFPVQTPKAIVSGMAPFIGGLMKEEDLYKLSTAGIAGSTSWRVPDRLLEKK